MYQSQTFAAGVGLEFQEPADFIRILEAPAADLELIFYRQGAEVARAQNVGDGYAEKLAVPFDKVRITSTGGGLVEFVTRLGAQVNYDKPPTGAVSIAGTVNVNAVGTQGAFTSAQKTVTAASGQLLAANAARRYLLVQNNDSTGVVYVNLEGAAATTTNAVRLLPGESLEIAGYVPSAEITAIGSIANNANVVAVEG